MITNETLAFMITKAKYDLPKIYWQKMFLAERIDQHTVVYNAFGISEDGRTFTSDLVIIDGDITEVENIEET